MPESQAHGFLLQDLLFTDIYGATADELRAISYTAELDLPGALNRLDPGIGISCKCTCNDKRIDMADCLRIYDSLHTGTPYHMLVAVYRHDDATRTKHITELIEVDMTGAVTELFGTVTREEIVMLDATIKAVPHGPLTSAEKSAIYALRSSLHTKIGAIQLSPKIDSKSQRRLQCSFNNFQHFLTMYPTRVIARGPPVAFRGKTLSTVSIVSGRRTRKLRIM